jgi:Flp pilus assembly protein CpaB
MNRRLVMVLVFAALVGLIASFFVYQVVRQLAAAGGPEATEPVVVAAVNMSMAESVTSQHVKVAQWPKGAIPAGAIRTLANAEGRVVRSAIVAGEPLLESRLTPEQTERLAVAQSEGRITLTTRNLRDNQVVRTPGATQATLLSDMLRPAVATAPTATVARRTTAAAAPLPAPAVEGHTVSVLRGSRLTEQQFIKLGDRGWMERQQAQQAERR